MRKSTIKLSFISALLLSLTLSPQAEAGFFSTTKHILVNLASGSKKITTSEYGEDSANEPKEPRDIGMPPATGNCVGEKPLSSSLIDLDTIKKIATGSKCASYRWLERRKATPGYMEGMALVYARAICNPNKIAANPKLGIEHKDALAYYGKEGSNRNTYALLIGMGMRESQGVYCWGQDTHAKENQTAEKAEAGIFQSSYNARNPLDEPAASKELKSLYQEYKDGKKECFLDTFSRGLKECSQDNLKNWGTGEGVTFQKLSKECPGFAAEFAAISVRINKAHYGTLKKNKEGEFQAEFREECVSMLTEIEKVVQLGSEICNKL